MYNRVIILGNVGRDVELRHTPGGTAVAKFSVATNDVWKDRNGQKQEHTEWFNVVAFGRTAEICGQYLGKGRQVFIEGTLRTRTYDDDKGQKRYFTEVHVQNLKLIGGRRDAGEQGPPEPGEFPPESDDDIPF